MDGETARQQVRVTAHFSDGSHRDVTRLAKYTVSDASVAEVDELGLVTGSKRGQTAVVVRYLDDIVSASLTFVRDVPGFAWQDTKESNYVDRLVNSKLRQLQFLPSALCDDSTFLRICSLGNDRYVGKLVDERLTTDRVEDIRRNIMSILQRICPDVRLPHQMDILAGSLETGELISEDQGGMW